MPLQQQQTDKNYTYLRHFFSLLNNKNKEHRRREKKQFSNHTYLRHFFSLLKNKNKEHRRREKEKKQLFTVFLVFNNCVKKIQKFSPKNDNLNKQKLQVLKQFLCFEKKHLNTVMPIFLKKELILDLSTTKKLRKIILTNFQIEFLQKKILEYRELKPFI